MNSRFPVLSFVSVVLRILGWLLVVGGSIYAVYEGIIEPNLPRHFFTGEDAMQLISGLGFALGGLMNVALGEIIDVFFAIEANTRRTSEVIEKMQAPKE